MINFTTFINKTVLALAVVAVFTIAPIASAATSATLVPACVITVTPASINGNQSALLKWDSTDGAIFASLDNGIGNIAPDGEIRVSPNTSTVYTMHTWNSQGEGGYCSAGLTVDGNGVYSPTQPTISLQTLAIHSASNRVILNNVPYTGASDFVYPLFLLAIMLTAGYVATTQRKVLFA
jgi:hypothetical protein